MFVLGSVPGRFFLSRKQRLINQTTMKIPCSWSRRLRCFREFLRIQCISIPQQKAQTKDIQNIPPRKLTWLAGKPTMNEDVFPIEHGDFPISHVSFQGWYQHWQLQKLYFFPSKHRSRQRAAPGNWGDWHLTQAQQDELDRLSEIFRRQQVGIALKRQWKAW